MDQLAPLHRWRQGTLAFARSVDEPLRAKAENATDAALIVPRDAPVLGCPCLRVDDPRHAFAVIARRFFTARPQAGIHPTALVAPGADIDVTASIGPFCRIDGNVRIGAETILHSHVCIAAGVTIGRGCVLHSHVSIGEDGFGIAPDADGHTYQIPHFGGVIIGDRVSLGNATTVHAGTLDPTVLEEGVMTDAQVYIAHNVHVGQDCQIAAGARLCGSVTLGARVWVGPNAAIHHGVSVGQGAVIGMGAVVLRGLPPKVIAAGVPARILRAVPPDWKL